MGADMTDFDPPTVLELIARIRKQEAKIQAVREVAERVPQIPDKKAGDFRPSDYVNTGARVLADQAPKPSTRQETTMLKDGNNYDGKGLVYNGGSCHNSIRTRHDRRHTMTYQQSAQDARHPSVGWDVRSDSIGLDASLNGVKVLDDVTHEVARELARRILEITDGIELEDTP